MIQGKIGLNAAHMVMELIRDNRKIVDRITHHHIDNFVQLLQKEKVQVMYSVLAKVNFLVSSKSLLTSCTHQHSAKCLKDVGISCCIAVRK